MGTPGYMAPEQADGRPVDARGDLFSLGCVLYRMATGEPPFKGDDLLSMLQAVSTTTPTPPRELNPSLPPPLCDLIRGLLAKKAEDRPPSARAVVEAIRAIEREGASSRTEIQVAASTGPAASRRPPTPAAGVSPRTWLPVAAVVLLGTLAYAAYLFGPAIVRYTSDEGELVIEIDDPGVQAVIDQTGATIHDKATGREYRVKPGRRDVKPLKAGDYEIEVTEVGGDMRLFTKEFTIMRGGATPVRVVFDAATLAKKPVALDPAAAAEKPVTEATNRELRRFEGHGDLIRTVVFSPDGRYLLSGSGGEYRAGQWLPGPTTRCGFGTFRRARRSANSWDTPAGSPAWHSPPDGHRAVPAVGTGRCGCGTSRRGRNSISLKGIPRRSMAWLFPRTASVPFRAASTTPCGCGTWRPARRSANLKDIRNGFAPWPSPRTAGTRFRAAGA